MSLIDATSDAAAGVAKGLSAAEAARTAILLMIELRESELLRGELQFQGPFSIERASFRVKPWFHGIYFGLPRHPKCTRRPNPACAVAMKCARALIEGTSTRIDGNPRCRRPQ